MEEKILKEILDVVIDIKAEQKIMKNKMDSMETKMDTMETKMDTMDVKVDKLSTEQIIMKEEIRDIKTETKLLSFKVTTLMKEQEGTKFAVGACVQKIR